MVEVCIVHRLDLEFKYNASVYCVEWTEYMLNGVVLENANSSFWASNTKRPTPGDYFSDCDGTCLVSEITRAVFFREGTARRTDRATWRGNTEKKELQFE